MSSALTPSELFLPDGVSRRSVVVGGACPPRLRPANAAENGEVDLAILAPTAEELRADQWLRTSVSILMRRLDPDGVIYALVPPGARSRLHNVLETAGAEVIRPVVHYPDWHRSHCLLSLDPQTMRYGIRRLVGLSPLKAAVADLALQLPGMAALVRARHPGVALAAQRSGTRPLGDWLARARGQLQSGGILVKSKWRGEHGTAVVLAVDERGSLRAVAKLALDRARGKERAHRESAALLRLASTARASGAEVPEAKVIEAGPGTVLLERPVDGLPAAALLRSRRESFPTFIARLTDWLVRWNQATERRGTADRAWLEEQVLQPTTALPSLRSRPAYLSWLRHRCDVLTGKPVPVVAAHNDLAMSNLVVTVKGQLGVLDWEAAGERLPLADLFYAAVDAASAQEGYVDRLEAFRQCFESDGRWCELVGGAEARICEATGTPREVAALSFHACWLQHAAAEAEKRVPGEPRPFLRIVESIADRRVRITGP